jgi:hypothetical protein
MQQYINVRNVMDLCAIIMASLELVLMVALLEANVFIVAARRRRMARESL